MPTVFTTLFPAGYETNHHWHAYDDGDGQH
jgi:hypothetical protein